MPRLPAPARGHADFARAPGRVARLVSLVVRALAPVPGVAGVPTCKYHPSCSQYASLAVRKHGLLRGSLMAVWRVARCNPWSHGGVDFP